MRVIRSVVAAAAVVAAMFGSAAVADAAVTTPWRIEYGASVAAGTIGWSDGRSATVSGTIHAVSGYREVCVWGVNGTSTSPVECDATFPGVDPSFSEVLTINKVGGVQVIYIHLSDQYDHDFGQLRCTRAGCVHQ
ncbi:hypothetical protein [Amycolatopsis sp. WQ 127309]|uniref:hypothetical protein n=1 Tax=Amycolatopsis sp. WQ 127309 TaxID=2932773 RepID=UPI001FF1E0D9|nr:hypothetical protein [Amycolatopsis sp. WQ 127309]UOZ07822.1 hypothetical protein MUY22_05900 [Amycolatopsis sp. WQ 127309]